jgi:hypothetical protein
MESNAGIAVRPGQGGHGISGWKKEALVVLALLILVVLNWLPRIEGPLDLRWDGGTYYVLGTALAEGKGYRLLNEPGEILGTQYPPLLPAIIAAHQLILGTSDPDTVGRWLRLTYFLMFTGYIVLSYYVLRRWLPIHCAFLATLICLLHLMAHILSDLAFAEIPFALASMTFVAFNRSSLSRGRSVIAGCLATAAYFLRTAGIALLLGWIAESLMKKDWKAASFRAVLALIPVLMWQSYIAAVEAGPSYTEPAYAYQRADYLFYNTSYARNISFLDPWSPEKGKATVPDLVARFASNLLLMPVSLGEAVSANTGYWNMWLYKIPGLDPPPLLMYLCPGVIGALILGGIILQLARGDGLIPVYLLAYMAAICLTPWPIQWTRYWVPVTPFLALSLVVCLLEIRRQVCKLVARPWAMATHGIVVGTLLILVPVEFLTLVDFYDRHHPLVSHVDWQGRESQYRLFYDDVDQELNQGLNWVRVHAGPHDVVATSMPHWAHLRTGLKTVMPPFEVDQDRTQAFLDSVPVRFVMVYKADKHFPIRYTLPVLESAPDRWSLVYQSAKDGLEIYERIHRNGLSQCCSPPIQSYP